MKRKGRPYDEVLTECAWCGNSFSPDDKKFYVPCTVDTSSNIITKEELKALEGQPVNVAFDIPTKDFRACVLYSNETNFGARNNIVFSTCSKICRDDLLKAIYKSKELVISKIDH